VTESSPWVLLRRALGAVSGKRAPAPHGRQRRSVQHHVTTGRGLQESHPQAAGCGEAPQPRQARLARPPRVPVPLGGLVAFALDHRAGGAMWPPARGSRPSGWRCRFALPASRWRWNPQRVLWWLVLMFLLHGRWSHDQARWCLCASCGLGGRLLMGGSRLRCPTRRATHVGVGAGALVGRRWSRA
jgi:hypothetical protein